MVKANHDGHYIKDPCRAQPWGEDHSNSNLQEKITTYKQALRKGKGKKEKKNQK